MPRSQESAGKRAYLRELSALPAACVVQEVVDGLADPVRVDAGAQARGSIDLAGEAAGSEARAGPLRAEGEQRMQLGLLEAEAELIVVTAGEQQQVAGDPGEPFGFGGRAVHRGCQFLAVAPWAACELKFPAQHRERSAQLVTGVGDERPLPRQRPLETTEQLVHRPGQRGDLVPGRRDIDAGCLPGRSSAARR